MKNKIFPTLLFLSAVSYGNAQKLSFSDKIFEKAVVEKFDLNKNGAIDQSEADKVINLFISNKIKVRSADDINLFKNVQTVILDGAIIISVNLKNLDNLSLFSCEACNMLDFQAENLKSLTSLYLNGNKLSQVSLKNTPEIYELVVSSNGLTSIDVRSLKKLMMLNIENNRITTLDVSQNPELRTLITKNNPLQEANIKRAKNPVVAPAGPSSSPIKPSHGN